MRGKGRESMLKYLGDIRIMLKTFNIICKYSFRRKGKEKNI